MMKRDFTIRFSVNWLLAIGVLAFGLIAAYYFASAEIRSAIAFAAAVLAATGAMLAAVNALDARVAALLQAKVTVAMDYGHRWNNPDFSRAKEGGREMLRAFKGLTIEQQKKWFEENAIRWAYVVDVLNFFESMAAAVRTDYADEETLKRLFRSLLAEYWHAMKAFMERRRAERLNPRLMQEMEWLFERWK